MTLSKYTDNLYQSEVYRELERQAVKKGFFKPTESEMVKLAAQEIERTASINAPVDTSASDDLVQDVARLAFAMRRKGFVTQAEDIEQKLVLYKQAENALYNVTQETNADFIQFAHRDGDVNLIEGSGNLGTFETMQSVADKIRAVLRKEPTGKLAALAASIVKSAQEQLAKAESIQDATGKLMEKDSQSLKDSVNICKEALQTFDGLRRTSPVQDGTVEDKFKINKPELNDAEASVYVSLANAAGAKTVSIDGIRTWFGIKRLAASKRMLQTSGNLSYVRLPVGADRNTILEFANALGNAGGAGIRQKFLDPGASNPAFDEDGDHDDYVHRGNYSDCILAINQAFDALYASQFGKGNEIVQSVNRALQAPVDAMLSAVRGISIELPREGINECFGKLSEITKALTEARTTFLGQLTAIKTFVDPSAIKQCIEWVDGLNAFIKQIYSKLAYAPGMKSVKIDSSELDGAIQSLETKNPTSDTVQTLKRIQKVISDVNGSSWFDIKAAIFDELGVDMSSKEQLERELKEMARWR